MKNFLDLLDINPIIEIKLTLLPIVDNGNPLIIVKHNTNILYNNELNNSIIIACNNNLMSPINVQIELYNKQYSTEKDTAVIVESLCIDNIEFIPNYTHLINYTNDHTHQDPTNYLGFNGIWELDISVPFYQWLHKVQGQGWLITK